MSRSSSGIINDDRQLDLCEFLGTSSSRPFHIWSDPTTKLMEVVVDGDQPSLPRMRKIRAVNAAIEAAVEKLSE